MWKLGLWPHNSFSGYICFEFFVLCHKSLTGTWKWRLGLLPWKFLFWEDMFRIFSIGSLQWRGAGRDFHLVTVRFVKAVLKLARQNTTNYSRLCSSLRRPDRPYFIMFVLQLPTVFFHTSCQLSYKLSWARICKPLRSSMLEFRTTYEGLEPRRNRSPGMDSKESIASAYVARRWAGTTTVILLCS